MKRCFSKLPGGNRLVNFQDRRLNFRKGMVIMGLIGVMKLEFERDIPVFRGKNWFERAALRREAQYKDPWLIWVSVFVGLLTFVPIFLFLHWFVRFYTHLSFAAFYILYFVLAIPINALLRALFVTPRIRR